MLLLEVFFPLTHCSTKDLSTWCKVLYQVLEDHQEVSPQEYSLGDLRLLDKVVHGQAVREINTESERRQFIDSGGQERRFI